MFLVQTPNSIENPLAFILMVGSAIGFAIYSCLIKTVKQVNPLALITWVSILSLPVIVCLTLLCETNQMTMLKTASFVSIFSVIYTGVMGSIAAHGLWCYLLSHNEINKIVMFIVLVPVFGVLGGVIILNEPITAEMIIGGILIILGVCSVVKKQEKKPSFIIKK